MSDMKFHFNKKYFYLGLSVALAIMSGILFYYILFHGADLSAAFDTFVTISMPIIDGLVLAYLMTPVLNAVEGRLVKPVYIKLNLSDTKKNRKRMRMISVILTVMVILWIAYEFFALIIPELIRSIQRIILIWKVWRHRFLRNIQRGFWIFSIQVFCRVSMNCSLHYLRALSGFSVLCGTL